MTSIKPCNCSHAYQDLKYGHGMRVHNARKPSKTGGPSESCTVCGKGQSPEHLKRKGVA